MNAARLLTKHRASLGAITTKFSKIYKTNGYASSAICKPQAVRLLQSTSPALNTNQRSLAAASSGASESLTSNIDNATYERVCVETLDSLCDHFEELLENANYISGGDVSYGDGVLTIKLGAEYGTYVINRQSPNKQIWLSSPTSGPKRYDFVGPIAAETGKWIYKHDGEAMHELLQRELQPIFKDQKVNFLELPFGS